MEYYGIHGSVVSRVSSLFEFEEAKVEVVSPLSPTRPNLSRAVLSVAASRTHLMLWVAIDCFLYLVWTSNPSIGPRSCQLYECHFT